MHGPHQQPEIQRGLMQKAETNIIVLTCCPGCEANAKSSPHTLSKVARNPWDSPTIPQGYPAQGQLPGILTKGDQVRVSSKLVRELRRTTNRTAKRAVP